MKKLIILSIFAFANLIVSAQSGSISGVINDETNQSMPFASVYVEQGGKKIGSTTDVDGHFAIKPLETGIYELHVSYLGYKESVVPKINVSSDKNTMLKPIKLSLADNIVGGKEGIVIIGTATNFIDPEITSQFEIRPAELIHLPGPKQPGLMIKALTTEAQVSEDGSEIIFRGARPNSSSYYVDGVKMDNLGSTIPGGAIGKMTVYFGGIPAKYGDLTGGAVIIETKSYYQMANEYKSRHRSN